MQMDMEVRCDTEVQGEMNWRVISGVLVSELWEESK